MSNPEVYDARISRIMAKIDGLRERQLQFSCGEWPPVWQPPLSEEQAAEFESRWGISLPGDYRRFITTVAASGSQPFYGLIAPQQEAQELDKPFDRGLDEPVIFLYMTEEELDAFWGEEDDEKELTDNGPFGLLGLCTEGCGMDSVLVVNAARPEVHGTVWFMDFANDFGLAPMRDPETGEVFHFLDWLEYWADKTTALADDEYFSYGDTVQMPEPPDNPEIMGRKMGWLD